MKIFKSSAILCIKVLKFLFLLLNKITENLFPTGGVIIKEEIFLKIKLYVIH